MSNKLEMALSLAKKGFKIFPLVHTLEDGSCSCGDPGCRSKGKHPIAGTRGWIDGTSDPFDIMEFFGENPEANYGVYPGNKFVIVDLDNKINKINGVDSFEQRTGFKFFDAADETFTVQSPSGGFHLYYKTDEAFACATNVIPGIDIRAVGGYVVGPGSKIGKNEYTVISDKEISGVPDSVVPILRRPRVREDNANEAIFELDTAPAVKRAVDFLSRRSPAVEGEGGDNHTYATFQLLKDIGVSLDRALELMSVKGGWNDRCDPPWLFSELKRIGEHAWRYGKSAAGIKGGGTYEDMFGAPIENSDWSDPDKDDEFRNLRDIAFFGSSLINRGKSREFIIPGWLPATGYTCLLAERGIGKSTIMLDLALRIACDMDWQGVPIRDDLVVAYICGEDDTGSELALKAWIEAHDMQPSEDRFLFLAGTVDLMSMNSVKLWTEFLAKEFAKDRRVVLFVDTWQRASSRGGQSKDEDMQIAVAHIEAMCKSLNGPCIVAFHPPKHNAGVIMGSSVIENSSTAIWNLTKGAIDRRLEVTRIKGDGCGNFANFDFEVIKFEEYDYFGIQKTAVIPVRTGGTCIVPSGDSQSNRRVEEITATQKALLAEVIRKTDIDRRINEPESKDFTFESLAIRVYGTSSRSLNYRGRNSMCSEASEIDSEGNPTDRAKFAKEILDSLASIGVDVRPLDWKTFCEFLKNRAFVNVAKYEYPPIQTDNGIRQDVLNFVSDGAKKRLVIN